MAKDYYEILGVGKNASKDEIKRAYRKLAHEHHPDKIEVGNDQKFKEVNAAYEVLSDDAKRAQYDRFGQTFEQSRSQGNAGFGGASGFSDFSDFMGGFDFGGFSAKTGSAFGEDFGDIFSDIFGGPRRGRSARGIDLEMSLTIDFLESAFGSAKEATIEKRDACYACKGAGGEPGTQIMTCPKCHGQGQIVRHRQTILGNIQQMETCDRCQGTGKAPEKECRVCRGAGMIKQAKTISINIPAGISDSQRIKITGEGEMGYRGSKTGDLYVRIKVRPHPEFRREGFDIYSEVPASFYQAALGADIEVNTVDGKVTMKVPAGTQSGDTLRLKGKAVPHVDSSRRGDHYVIIRVITPRKLSRREKELFQKLAEESGESVQIDKKFWEKLRDSFN